MYRNYYDIIIASCLLIVGCTTQIEESTYEHLPIPDEYHISIPVQDTMIAALTGQILFTNPMVTVDGEFRSCNSCHSLMHSGYSGVKFGFGMGGDGIGMHRRSISDSVDVQPVRTPTFLNAFTLENALWDGSMGCGGFNEGMPDSIMSKHSPHSNCDLDLHGTIVQAEKGSFEVHNVDFERCKDNELLKKMMDLSFGDDEVTRLRIAQCISIFEQTYRSVNAPFQKYLRGEGVVDSRMIKAVSIFDNKCVSCHNGYALGNTMLSPKIAKSDFQGRFAFTGDSLDMDLIKVPPLYNLKDSRYYMHDSSAKSIPEAIRMHDIKLTGRELRLLTYFLEYSLHDESVKDNPITVLNH